jgi:hypothetical protein
MNSNPSALLATVEKEAPLDDMTPTLPLPVVVWAPIVTMGLPEKGVLKLMVRFVDEVTTTLNP